MFSAFAFLAARQPWTEYAGLGVLLCGIVSRGLLRQLAGYMSTLFKMARQVT